jgi:predicted DNA-binding protein (UPF0251 family)
MPKRGKPKKSRIVQTNPQIRQFSPRGRPGRPDEVHLNLDEFEAIRLAHFEGKSQKESASDMQISQQTFSRILRQANQKIAEALTIGKRIKITDDASYIIHINGLTTISVRSDVKINQQNLP